MSNMENHYDQYSGEMGFFGLSALFVFSVIGLGVGLFTKDYGTIISSSLFAVFSLMGAILCYCCIGTEGEFKITRIKKVGGSHE